MTDVILNPQTPIIEGEAVSDTNPLPVSSATALGTPVAGLLNPVTWVVNGELVSDSNPLPVTLV
jgi:hypothetical protein